MNSTNGLDYKISEMAARIRDLRELKGFSIEDMAEKTGITPDEYIACEAGTGDLTFSFIYRCATVFGVDVTDIIEGHSPKLKSFTVTRSGAGQEVSSAHGMTYFNMAYAFQNRIAEPLFVRSSYDADNVQNDIELTTHDGQECDIVIEGNLMVQVGEHREVLGPGDSIYLDSNTPHGMIAVNGKSCSFYAIVLNPAGEPIPELTSVPKIKTEGKKNQDTKDRLYKKFIDAEEDENGTPTKITFKNTKKFNFAFDIVDELGRREPDKLAMLHISEDKTERRFTFRDMKVMSAQAANYFSSLGIGKGDRVLLILRRNYQFWPIMLGLNKIGAIAIPAVIQLKEHDLNYRLNAAGVSTIICTADGDITSEADKALESYGKIKNKIITNGSREGWRSYDDECPRFSSHFRKTDLSPGGEDSLLMFFTSGTSSNPKMVVHNHKYPLGHFHTAKYWHNVDPEGLHFTISDTGWAKAMWGKLYGQWLCEAATFVYDFDRFNAADILPMFAKYNITTFCAPPTMLRLLIKQDISHYDLSSIQHMTTAGEALNPEVYRQFQNVLGLQILEGYGQSESTMIMGNLVGTQHKVGSMGKPAPIYDVILMGKDGNEVPTGETGEICINIKNGGPCGLFTGYYDGPEATDKVMYNGYYHTGDTAWKDEDGFYWFVGRIDDVIKSSGYRIGPLEVENTIMELAYVLECGVSPEPDPVRGQIVKASIVLVQGTEPTEELKKEIQEYVMNHTAPYKYPRKVVFRESLPKTASGKIQRNLL
ncbi:MAG: AMP-binding protein [Lachnospiraceae bacterium]|nr:AMP-binding protein [Lachnospiraceae bacterium]